jgi:hypothetical protein
MAEKENPVEATTIVQNLVLLFVKHVLWKKKKLKKVREKSAGNPKKGEKSVCANAPSDLWSSVPTFCTTTIVKKTRWKSAHAHAITSGSTTTANMVLSVPIYYSRKFKMTTTARQMFRNRRDSRWADKLWSVTILSF